MTLSLGGSQALQQNLAAQFDPASISGDTGLIRSDGFIQEDIDARMLFPRAAHQFKAMVDTDPLVGAMMFSVKMLIRTVPWYIKASSPSQAAADNASHMQSCLGDMEKPFVDVVDDFVTMLDHGFALNYIVLKRRMGRTRDKRFSSKYSDGRWGIRKLPARAQNTIQEWIFDDVDGEEVLRGAIQRNPNSGALTPLSIDKMLHFRVNTVKDNPESTSILRPAFEPWYFRRNLQRAEAIGTTRDLQGLPIFWLPQEWMSKSATPSQKAFYRTIRTYAKNIFNGKQAAMVLPMLYDANNNPVTKFELAESRGSKQFDVEKIIDRLGTEMLQVILADFIKMGSTSVGSFALSSNKTKLFSVAVGSWLGQIVNGFQKVIDMIAELEGWDPEEVPTLAHGDLESQDLDTVANFLDKTAQRGIITPDEGLENMARRLIGAPPLQQEVTSTSRIATLRGKVESEVTDAPEDSPAGDEPESDTGATGDPEPEEAGRGVQTTASPSSPSNLKP